MKKRNAFTLAEVLITLGIIGIVAAMTLPAITSAYRKNVIETELKKTYSLLNQLIRRSEVDNESATTWNWENTLDYELTNQFFDKYFAPYLQITNRKRSYGDDRWYSVYSSIGEGPSWQYNNSHNADWIRLADGRVIMLSLYGRDNIYYGTWSVIVSSAVRNSHLVSGRDIFAFTININKDKSSVTVFPNSYWNWSCDTLKTNRQSFLDKCRAVDNSGSGIYPEHYCTMLIYCNNWKIPKDYPVKI